MRFLRGFLDKKAVTKMQAAVLVAIIVVAAIIGMVYYFVFAPKPVEKKEILFGSTAALSGEELAPAWSIWAAQQVAIDDINAEGGIYVPELGKRLPVRRIYYDDENDASKAATYYERLITVDKVDFLLSCFNDANLLAVTTLCEKNKIPIICTGAVSDKICARGLKYTFDFFFYAKSFGETVIDFLADLRKKVPPDVAPKKLALLATNDDLAVTAENQKAYAEKLGFEVVYYKIYADPGTNDFTPFIQDMKNLNVDVVIDEGHSLDAALLVKQMVELGFCPKAFAAGIGYFDPAFLESVGKYGYETLSGTGWPAPETPEQKKWFEETGKKAEKYYKSYSMMEVLCAYTGVMILKEAIEHVGLDRDKVRDYIATKEFKFPWLTITIKFDETGLYPLKWNAVGQLINGVKTIVWPPAAAAADPIYPMTPWDKR